MGKRELLPVFAALLYHIGDSDLFMFPCQNFMSAFKILECPKGLSPFAENFYPVKTPEPQSLTFLIFDYSQIFCYFLNSSTQLFSLISPFLSLFPWANQPSQTALSCNNLFSHFPSSFCSAIDFLHVIYYYYFSQSLLLCSTNTCPQHFLSGFLCRKVL